MSQRVAVRALVYGDDSRLLLRRIDRRMKVSQELFELPGGRIKRGEQAEDALRRTVLTPYRLVLGSSELDDVVTYNDSAKDSIQHIVLLYRVNVKPGTEKIYLQARYKNYVWLSDQEIKQARLTELTDLLLGMIQQSQLVQVSNNKYLDSYHQGINSSVVIFSDGGSRGNPGHSAAGFVMLDRNSNVIEQGGEYLGITTSWQAEYHGVRLGLERALELGYRNVDFRVDNLMVVKQMNGVYRIKNRELWPIHERIRDLVSQFESVRFSHVKRELNKLADTVVNQTLDKHSNSDHFRV